MRPENGSWPRCDADGVLGPERDRAGDGGSEADRQAPRRGARRREGPRLHQDIKKHPGSRSEELCGEFGTDAVSLRPVLHELHDDGELKVEGKARATRYSVS